MPLNDHDLGRLDDALQANDFALARRIFPAKETEEDKALNLLLITYATEGNVEACKFLLEVGANPKAHFKYTPEEKFTGGNIDGFTPLHAAAAAGHADICQLLITVGRVNVDVINPETGQSPLFVAATRGHEKVCDALLRNGASCNLMDYSGQLPIHLAAKNAHFLVCETLLNAGTPVDATNAMHNSILICAADGKEDAQKNRLKICTSLLRRGANVDLANVASRTPLMTAARHGNEDLCRLFVEKGADLTLRNDSGETAADIAKENGFLKLSETLETQERRAPIGKPPIAPRTRTKATVATEATAQQRKIEYQKSVIIP